MTLFMIAASWSIDGNPTCIVLMDRPDDSLFARPTTTVSESLCDYDGCFVGPSPVTVRESTEGYIIT